MNIRHVSKKDLPDIVQLMNELGYDSEEDQIRKRISDIRKRQGEVLVAVDDRDEIVGCVHALIDVRLAEGKIGEIVSLVVKNNSRGQGIGTELLKKAIGWIRETGCTKIKVRANSIRKEAHQFYKSHGFEEVKTQKIFKMKSII